MSDQVETSTNYPPRPIDADDLFSGLQRFPPESWNSPCGYLVPRINSSLHEYCLVPVDYLRAQDSAGVVQVAARCNLLRVRIHVPVPDGYRERVKIGIDASVRPNDGPCTY